VVVLVACSACGDNTAPWCVHDDRDAGPFRICYPAETFAARDTAGLVPTQHEVDRYADRWERAIDAEPILNGRGPQRFLSGVFTRNRKVIAAWTQGQVETGDTTFDAISAELRINQIHPFWTQYSDDLYSFRPYIRVFFNETVWIDRLAATDSWPWFPDNPPSWPLPSGPFDDGWWSWVDEPGGTGQDSSTAQIVFTFGWGDCAVKCDGFHTVRAVVPADAAAIVYDLGGDPLPDYLHLSPNTLPM
jgi:hypothetical protein